VFVVYTEGVADKEAERIKYETEVLKFIGLVTVAIGGGSISLVLGERTRWRIGLALLGWAATLALFGICRRLDRRIRTLIEQIGKTP